MNEGMPDLSEKYPSASELRRWAQSRPAGADIPNRGRLPRFVILAWDRAHPDRPFVASEGHHGTPGGYRAHDCHCAGCLAAVRADGAQRYRDARDERDGELADTFLRDEGATR